MRTPFVAIAGLLVASQPAEALDWSDVKQFGQNFDFEQLYEMIQDSEIYESVVAWSKTNRHTASKKLHEDKRRIPQLTTHQRHQYNEAHHRLEARREKLGLAKIGAGAGPNVGQNYDQLNSFSGSVLNTLKGMSYGTATNSQCYSAFESIIVSLDTSSDVLKKIYIPAWLPEAQVQMQDLFYVFSALWVDCKFDKFFTTVSHLATSEGVTELVARTSGALPFELSTCIDIYQNPENFTKREKGYANGKCISIILNWTI